jgi:dodecin
MEEMATAGAPQIVEISAVSPEGYAAAISEGLQRASRGLTNIQSVWVNEQRVDVGKNEISEWRVTMQVTFIPD